MTGQSCCVGLQLRSVTLSVWPKKWCTYSSSTKSWLLSSMRQHHTPQAGATSSVWCMGAQSWREVTLLCCKSMTYRPHCSIVCVSHAQRMRLGKLSLTNSCPGRVANKFLELERDTKPHCMIFPTIACTRVTWASWNIGFCWNSICPMVC